MGTPRDENTGVITWRDVSDLMEGIESEQQCRVTIVQYIHRNYSKGYCELYFTASAHLGHKMYPQDCLAVCTQAWPSKGFKTAPALMFHMLWELSTKIADNPLRSRPAAVLTPLEIAIEEAVSQGLSPLDTANADS